MLLISNRRTRKKYEGGEDVMRWRRKTNDSKQKIYACFKQADFLLIVQMLIWQILKCCSKYVFVPNLCHIPPPPLFSSWRSLLTFLCLGNFHFHSHTWNIQICLLLPSKAGQMQQLFENKILQFLKVRGADYGLFRISSWQYTKCPSLSSSTIYT